MSSNKGIKRRMIQKYGSICMIEEAGIRKIPVEVRRQIKGYKKSDDMITYHHIKPKSRGGQATEQNGALLKGYNHSWLESLPRAEKDSINEQLQTFKLNFTGLKNGLTTTQSGSLDLDFNQLRKSNDCIIIPVYDGDKQKIKGKQKYPHPTRAQIKEDTRKQIAESLKNTDEESLDR